MLIIAGRTCVAPQERDEWVDAHDDAITRARSAPGYLDRSISADLIEADRVKLFELWEPEEHLEAWRTVAHPTPRPGSLCGQVQRHQSNSSGPPD